MSTTHRIAMSTLADTLIAHFGEGESDLDVLDAYAAVAPYLPEADRQELADHLDICSRHVCDIFICLDDNADCVSE